LLIVGELAEEVAAAPVVAGSAEKAAAVVTTGNAARATEMGAINERGGHILAYSVRTIAKLAKLQHGYYFVSPSSFLAYGT